MYDIVLEKHRDTIKTGGFWHYTAKSRGKI